jgi:cytochrome c-type biogenesis protein CcmF
MSQIGSFALLLALALSSYSFLAGVLALARPGPGSERLGETARRAGIATFAVVFLAALILVISAFQDNFSIAYIYHHSNRDLPAPYKFATLWSGQEGSLLFWSLLLSAYGPTDWSCACGTRLMPGFLPTPPPLLRQCRFSFFFC